MKDVWRRKKESNRGREMFEMNAKEKRRRAGGDRRSREI